MVQILIVNHAEKMIVKRHKYIVIIMNRVLFYVQGLILVKIHKYIVHIMHYVQLFVKMVVVVVDHVMEL